MNLTAKRASTTEAELLAQVLSIAHLYGWRTAHFRPAKTAYGWRTAVQGDGKGYPDLTLVRDDRLIFAELKSENGRLTSDQKAWMAALGAVPKAETYIWRPDDIRDIAKVLERVSASRS